MADFGSRYPDDVLSRYGAAFIWIIWVLLEMRGLAIRVVFRYMQCYL